MEIRVYPDGLAIRTLGVCVDPVEQYPETNIIHNVFPHRMLNQVNRPKNSSNWTLQIKYPQLRDSGVYECQINTEPKMSLFYTLQVVGECKV